MRNVSNIARQALFAQETDKVFLVLLTIDHSDLSEPIRVVNNTVNIEVPPDGPLYIGYPFLIHMPRDSGDEVSKVRLRIDNVHRDIVYAVRSIDSPPDVEMSIVLAETPNIVEAGPFSFTLKDAKYDALVVEGELSYEDILNEAWPADQFTPSSHPGLF